MAHIKKAVDVLYNKDMIKVECVNKSRHTYQQVISHLNFSEYSPVSNMYRFIYVASLIHVCDMTHSYVWHKFGMTRSYV